MTGTTGSGLINTGAQMCKTGIKVATRMGLRVENLLDCKMRVSAANNVVMEILGAAFLTFSGAGGVQSQHMVHFPTGLQEFFISKETCRALGIVDDNFPRVGAHSQWMVCGASRRRSSSAPPPLTVSGDVTNHCETGILGSPSRGQGTSSDVDNLQLTYSILSQL